MTNQIVIHRGPWECESDTTKEPCPALQFMKSYLQAIESSTRSSAPWSNFYSTLAVYHDTKGDALIGGYNIWEKLKNLLHPFSYIHHEPVEIRIVPCDVVPGRKVVYGEFVTHFLLRGDLEGEEILVPKFGVWTLGYGEAEEDEEGEAGGEGGKIDGEGLRIMDVKQFYDNAIIGRYVTEKRKREAKKRRFDDDDEENRGSRSAIRLMQTN